MQSTLTKHQVKEYGWKEYTENGNSMRIKAIVRYDDQCGNGHNSFSITGTTEGKLRSRWTDYSGGCIHEEIVKHFPELAHLIKWHLCSSDGPMHYISNTTYHASDKDYHGLRKGEERQLRYVKTGLLCWKLDDEIKIEKYVDAEKCPTQTVTLRYKAWTRIGEGKTQDLEAARRCAIWPDATLEQLQDKKALEARLPDLIKEFKKDVESLGFIF